MAEQNLPQARLEILSQRAPPWQYIKNVSVHKSARSRCDEPRAKFIAAMECLYDVYRMCQAACRLVIWKDGSVTEDEVGGGGFLIEEHCSNAAREVECGSVPAGKIATSFTAEAAAATAALKAALPMVNADTDIVLIMDSRSLLDGIVGDPYHMSPDVTSSYSALSDVAEQARSTHVVWVRSHCGIKGNDRANHLAKLGCDGDQGNIDLPVQAAKSFIRNATAYPRPLLKIKKLGPDNTGRKTTSTLNQLLAGHSSLLNEYLHRISARPSPDCESCVETAENADHLLLKCPSRKSSRDLSNLAEFADVREAILTEPSQALQFLQLEGLL